MRLRTYARIAAVALLATAIVGWAVPGWQEGAALYHLFLALLFGYVGFLAPDHLYPRQMVMGLGVLVLVVKAVEVLASWLASGHFLHGPIEITCLIVGVTSIPASIYLPDAMGGDSSRRRRPW